MSELAETVERRRKRVEAANARAAQRDAAQQQQQGDDASEGSTVAQLSIPEQLAWAAKRARHRPMGGGLQ